MIHLKEFVLFSGGYLEILSNHCLSPTFDPPFDRSREVWRRRESEPKRSSATFRSSTSCSGLHSWCSGFFDPSLCPRSLLVRSEGLDLNRIFFFVLRLKEEDCRERDASIEGFPAVEWQDREDPVASDASMACHGRRFRSRVRLELGAPAGRLRSLVLVFWI